MPILAAKLSEQPSALSLFHRRPNIPPRPLPLRLQVSLVSYRKHFRQPHRNTADGSARRAALLSVREIIIPNLKREAQSRRTDVLNR